MNLKQKVVLTTNSYIYACNFVQKSILNIATCTNFYTKSLNAIE